MLIGGGGLESGSTSNGLHLNGSFPSRTDPDNWTASGATGSNSAAGASTTAFGLCLANGPKQAQVVEVAVSGPSEPESWTRAVAVCPNGFVVVGGGAKTDPDTAGSLKPIGSFPSDASGNPVSGGSANPSAWTAVGLNGGQAADGAITRAFALCARAKRIAMRVVSLSAAGPVAAGTAVSGTATCPAGGASLLLGGGIFVTAAGGAIPQTGVHLVRDLPQRL